MFFSGVLNKLLCFPVNIVTETLVYLKVRSIVKNMENLSDESEEIMLNMDQYTALNSSVAPQSFIEEPKYVNEDIKTEDIDLGWKKSGPSFDDWTKTRVKTSETKVGNKVKLDIMLEDDILGDTSGFFEKVIMALTRNDNIFPRHDKTLIEDSLDKVIALRDQLKLKPGGGAMPLPYHDWGEDLTTDQTFNRFFFYGIGAVLLSYQMEDLDSQYGPFVVDLPIQDLEVRPGYRPYGARVHFNQDQEATAIMDYAKGILYKPGDNGWEAAKYLAKVTAFTVLTAREHLLHTHMLCSNVVTLYKSECLPPSHPLRRLLTIFTFRTAEVNANASRALFPKLCMLHRCVAFTYSSYVKVFEEGMKQCSIFKPFDSRTVCPSLKKLSDEGQFPYLADGLGYYAVVKNFVSEWLAKSGDACCDAQAKSFYNNVKDSTKGQLYELPDFESEDAMLNLLTQFIFVVTAYHEVVGTVIDYTQLPTGSGFRAVEGANQNDVQSYLLMCLITASTSFRTPFLMRPFNSYFSAGGAPDWERGVWNNFLNELESQSTRVQEANQRRTVDYQFLDPKRFESAVSV